MHLMRRQQTWDPFRELENLNSQLARMFGGTRPSTEEGEREALTLADWIPSVDISETDKEYRIRAELPAVNKDDVEVTLDDGVLTMRGQRREEKKNDEGKVHRRELSYGQFMRRFSMPADIDEGKVQAEFKDGMLDVHVAKSEAKSPKARQIKVK